MSNLLKPTLSVVALSLSLFNTACSMETVSSRDVNSEAVYQTYALNYDESSNSTAMSAQFRVGGWSGTTVNLDEPSAVKINGRTPSKSTMLGTNYRLESGGFIPTATFEYKTSEGKTLTNHISISPVLLRYAPASASVYRTYEVDMEAPNLESEESVRVTLSQSLYDPQTGTNKYASADGNFDRTRNKAVFLSSALNQLSNGPATLKIVRSKSGRLVQSTREGGMISANYSLRDVSVTIVDKLGGAVIAPQARN